MGIQINGATDSITAIDGTIDVVSAIGNAGVVTATAFVGNITGNVTGNINHTSNLELQVGGVTRANIDSDGNLTFSGGELALNRQGALNAIEIGKGQNSNQYAYIDLIGDTTYTDFGFRMMREHTGPNAKSKLQHRGTGDFVISSADSSSLSFETGGSERLRITPGGHLQAAGITTSNTGFMFGTGGQHYLYQSASDTATLRITSDGPYVEFKDVSGDVQMGSASGTLRLSAGGNEKVRIDSSGQMGLGTISPSGMFEVQKNGVPAIIANYNNQKHLQMGAGGSGAGFHLTTGNFFTINHQPYADKGTDNNLTERLRITSDGKVGINSTSPSTPLEIHTAASAAWKFRINTSVSDGVGFYQRANGDFEVVLRDASNGNNYIAGSAGGLQFATSGTEKLRIDSNGYVTKPAHPSFIAGRTGGNQTFTVGTYPLTVARLNVGNHYNTSTYKFVAPVAGVYYFYGQVYYNNGAGQYRLHIRKTPNGGSAINLNTSSHKIDAGHPSGANDTSDSTSIIESMAVGDSVELYCDQNHSIQCYYNINDNTYGAHTYFMGYLIG